MICKKITALILSFVFLMCGTSVCVFAQTESPVTVSDETLTVVIDVPSVQYAGTVVALSVWKPGYSGKDMADVFLKTKNISDINAYTGEVVIDAEKRIKETFMLDKDAPSGTYLIEIHVPGSLSPETYTFNFRNVARAAKTLEIVKGGEAESIKTAFESGILDIDVDNGTKYLSYNPDVKTYITNNVIKLAPQDEEALRTALSDGILKIEAVSELVSLNENREKLKEHTEENCSLFLLNSSDDNCWTDYENLTEIQKEQFYINFAAKVSVCVFPEDVKNLFKQEITTIKNQNTGVPTPAPKPTSKPSSGGGGGGGGGGKTSSNISVSSDTVEKQPEPLKAPEISFDDTKNHWAMGVIEFLASRGIINGKSEKEFAPDDYITREEFVKLIVTALDLKSASVEVMPFKDAIKDEWYYSYIETAQALDVVSGVAEDAFGIGQNITRQDLVTILDKAASKTGRTFSDSAAEFTDSEQIAIYAKNAVVKLGGAGVVNGYEDGSFRPYECATRAEAVQMIYNTMSQLNLF